MELKKILLDTNAYSNFLRGEESVLNVLASAERIVLSIIVIAELYYGFKGGLKEIKNQAYLAEFLKKPSVEVMDANQETAMIFSEIKHQLKKIGKPIPINDVWIAAHTIQSGAVIVTFDQHFKYIPGLRIWEPSAF